MSTPPPGDLRDEPAPGVGGLSRWILLSAAASAGVLGGIHFT